MALSGLRHTGKRGGDRHFPRTSACQLRVGGGGASTLLRIQDDINLTWGTAREVRATRGFGEIEQRKAKRQDWTIASLAACHQCVHGQVTKGMHPDDSIGVHCQYCREMLPQSSSGEVNMDNKESESLGVAKCSNPAMPATRTVSSSFQATTTSRTRASRSTKESDKVPNWQQGTKTSSADLLSHTPAFQPRL